MKDNRLLRKRITIAAILLLIPIAYWPGGEVVENALTPRVYFLWVVIGIPSVLVLIFAVNAFMNIQEDERLEEQERNAETAVADGRGDS